MTNRTPIRLTAKIAIPLTALWISACGVKGPPEPPLINEASVKRTEDGAAGTANTTTNQTPAESPVIFPKKDDKKPSKKPSGKTEKAATKTTEKPAAAETKDKKGQ